MTSNLAPSPTRRQVQGWWKYLSGCLTTRYSRYTMLSVFAAACLAVYSREGAWCAQWAEWCPWSMIPSTWMLVVLAMCLTSGPWVLRRD